MVPSRNRRKRFAVRKASFDLASAVSRHVVDTTGEHTRKQEQTAASSHYRLSSLILRHCLTDTGSSDDATRLPKDNAPWRWYRWKASRSRFREAKRGKKNEKPENENYDTTCTIFLLAQYSRILIWTETPWILVLIRGWYCGHHVEPDLRHRCESHCVLKRNRRTNIR